MTENLFASSDYQWCLDEFSGVELHDARLSARCSQLAVQLAMQPSLRSTVGLLFLNKFVIMVLFIVWAVFASRPFCRTTCPLGAFYALFKKVKMVKLRFIEENCTNCKACHHVCPMGVKFNESPEDAECISCLACMNRACRFDAIALEIAGVPLGTTPKTRAPATAKTS